MTPPKNEPESSLLQDLFTFLMMAYLLLIFSGFTIASAMIYDHYAHPRATRVQCLSGLRSTGQAMQLYQPDTTASPIESPDATPADIETVQNP